MSSKFTREVFLSVCHEVIRTVDKQIKENKYGIAELESAINTLHGLTHYSCVITRPYGCSKCHNACEDFNFIINKLEEYQNRYKVMKNNVCKMPADLVWPK